MPELSRTEVENQIKILSDRSWLTQSQSAVLYRLLPFLGGLDRVVNVHGLQGVGKTFLMHVLAKEGIVEYVVSPDMIRDAEHPLVIDNASFERGAVRGMRNEMRKFDLRQVVLVTRYRAEDAIPAFALDVTLDDVQIFRANLFRHLDLRLPESSRLNFWEHLKLIGGIYG